MPSGAVHPIMAGLVPAVHVFIVSAPQVVDARVKPGHDDREISAASSFEGRFAATSG